MSLDLLSTKDSVEQFIFSEIPPGNRGLLGRIRIPLPGRTYNGQEVSVDIVQSADHREAACELVNRMYAWRGYGSSHRIPARSSHTTFTVSAGQEIIGTITLAADSDNGLAVDALFRNEIDAARAQPDTHVCELTKFAFDAAADSKHLLAALFHVVFIYGVWRHQGTDLFIEVNPRHRRFYESMLGFERIGEIQNNESVNAPSQLMRLRVTNIRQYIGKGIGASSARSLYPHFLSSLEEATVCIDLWRAIDQLKAGAEPDSASMHYGEPRQVAVKAQMPKVNARFN